MNLLSQHIYLGMVVTLAAYLFGAWLKKQTGKSWCNPLLIACVIVAALLLLTGSDYGEYKASTSILTHLLTPATVCLAIPLYRQFRQLKDNWRAILAGVAAGAVASMGLVLLLAVCFELDRSQFVTLLPKSVTTAIGMELSAQAGGMAPITVAAIVITGIVGSVTAQPICKLLRIRDPIAFGVAIGTSSHVIGTSKAMEIGEIEGAISSLATVVSGLLTTVFFSLFASLY